MKDEQTPPAEAFGSTAGLGRIRVEVKNEFLGNSVFWEGAAADIRMIHNIPARQTAELVAKDGKARVCGMWHVSMLRVRSNVEVSR
jgi:hypothetical protein